MIAHRGGGSSAPENTMAALRAGVAAGYRAVEFDVMLAADGEPVLMHDEVLGRTVRGAGRVPQFTSAQLRAADAGSWHSPAFAGEGVPLYRQALDYCLSQDVWMNVELKPATGFEAQTGATVARLTRQWLGAGAAGRLLFSSFSLPALRAAQQAAPDIARGWLLERLPPHWPQQAAQLGVASLHMLHSSLSASDARAIRAAGYGLFCYTVNTEADFRRLAAMPVDAICTDRIDRFPPQALGPPDA